MEGFLRLPEEQLAAKEKQLKEIEKQVQKAQIEDNSSANCGGQTHVLSAGVSSA